MEPSQPGTETIQLWRLAAWLGFAIAFLTATGLSSDAWPILHFWTKGTNALVALVGAHLLVNLLLPISLWLQFRYARRFSLRSRPQRVPPIIGRVLDFPQTISPVVAGVTLLFFNIAPLYVAAAALDHVFAPERMVVIYRTDLTAQARQGGGFQCDFDRGQMCGRAEINWWCPLPDHPYGWNSYHSAADDPPRWTAAKANVWPLVTPALLIGGFLLSLGGAMAVLLVTFRSARGPPFLAILRPVVSAAAGRGCAGLAASGAARNLSPARASRPRASLVPHRNMDRRIAG